VQCDRRRGIRKPNAQQSLLEGAAIARRAERRRLAGLGQQGDGQPSADHGGAEQGASAVAWVGCQWLMEGYCGRATENQLATPAPQRQQGDGQSNDTDPPQRPNRAA
jgi:hypothetical protein